MSVDEIAAGRELLAGVPLLAGADGETIAEIDRLVRPVHVHAGDDVVRQGEPGDRLYLVRSGRLRVFVEGAEGLRAVRELGPGATIGELALLTGAPRSATVQAMRDSDLLELDAEVFHDLLRRDPEFAVSVARTLAELLQASGELLPPPVRPSVLSIGALGPLDVASFAVDLGDALSPFGRVAVLTAADGRDGGAAALDRAERGNAHVLLVDPGGDEDWSAFCARQSDRHVALAAPGADDPALAPAGADVVVVEALQRDRLARLLTEVAPRAHHHLEPGRGAASVSRLARRLVGRALGVVLSGGGARGYAHIGAIEALAEAGFEIDRLGGCSIGSFIGGMYASGASPDDIREVCRRELVRRQPFNDYTLPRVSLIRSRKAAKMFDRVFGDRFMEELPISFFTVSADLLASRTIVHRSGPVFEAVGASMSIPGLVPPLSRPGRLLVDGGVLNNLPVDVMAADDEGPIVAVDVIRRLEEVDESATPPLPSIVETLSRATVLGSVERAERNRRLADLVVTPDVQDVALREFSALDRAADVGRAAMRVALEEGGAESLRELLAESA
jgi:predicted acylesterase/phospholipase RssA